MNWSWADFWAPNIVQWVLGGAVSALAALWVRRMVKIRAERFDQLLRAAEAILGATTTIPVQQKATTMDLRQARKALAAGFGIMLTGLLTWVETANLEPVIGPLVPDAFRPLVGVILGGLATIASVYLAKNNPAPADTAAVDETPAPVEAPASVTPAAIPASAVPSLASFAQPTEAAPIINVVTPPEPILPAPLPVATNETSIVQLLPAPVGSYL